MSQVTCSAGPRADDITDTDADLVAQLAAFEGRSSLRTWTFTILVNRARTRGAREARTLPRYYRR
jgi:RNA polymerase sigma-70 factor (ECF subfamily)